MKEELLLEKVGGDWWKTIESVQPTLVPRARWMRSPGFDYLVWPAKLADASIWPGPLFQKTGR
jgi:hypothetical protein